MALLKLLFVRHGQSVGNVEGRMEGCQSTPLTPLGRQQSRQLGQSLAAEGWYPTHVYCSPLWRSRATLEAMLMGFSESNNSQTLSTSPLRQGPDSSPSEAPPHISFPDLLKEYNHGIFDGLTWAEAQERYPDLCRELVTELDWRPIPQAETLSQGRQRARQFVEQLLDQHRNGDRVWVISHHWILQHMLAELLGCDRTWGLPMANTGIFEFWLDCDRWTEEGENRFNSELWQLKRFNHCAHWEASL